MDLHEAYTNVLKEHATRHPDYADVWNSLGLMLAEKQNYAGALNAFETAVALNPRFTRAAISHCFALGDCGRVEEGFRLFQSVASSTADDFKTVFPLGVFCMRFGWKQTGLRQLLRAEKIKPNVPFVIGHVAKALLENGMETESERRREHMKKVVASIKIDALTAAIEQQGDVLDRYGRWVNPHFADIHVMLARHLVLQGQVEESTYELLLGNSRFPGHSKLMVEMGRNLISREQPEKAMDWLSAAILLDQNCYDGFYETSFLHATKDKLNLASQALKHAVTLRPLLPGFRFHLGTLLMDLGATDDAITAFRRALVIRPDDGLCSLHLASALVEKSQPEEALKTIHKSNCREWPEALLVAARAHLALGNEEAAQEIVDDLVARDPSYTEAGELLEAMSHEPG